MHSHHSIEPVNNARNLNMIRFFTLLFFVPALATIEVVHETPAPTTQYYFLSMKGSYEHVSGAPHRAARTYSLVNKLSPNNQQLSHAMTRLAFERGDYRAVVANSSAISPDDPAQKDIALLLAQSYLFCEQVEHALPLLKQLSTLYPHDNRIDYYTALTLLKAHRLSEAQKLIDKVLSQETHEAKHFLFHFLNAKIAFLENNFSVAKKHIVRCLQDNPRFAKGIVLKAVIAEKQHHTDEALATYESYLQLTKDPEITGKVIALCFSTGRYQRARELLQSQPRDAADYYHDIALILYKLGDKKNALKNIEKSLEKDPQYQKSYTLCAHLLIAEKQFDELQDRFSRWLAAHTNNHALISTWYRLTKKGLPYVTAANTLDAAIRENDSFMLMFALADLHHEYNQLDAARRWYQWALKKAPTPLDTSKMWFQIARTHCAQNNHLESLSANKKALAQKVVYPSAHNLMALLLIETDPHAARDHSKKALLADPKNESYLATKKLLD